MRLCMLFRRKQALSFQYADSLYVVINLKYSVVKLTCGDYNGKYSEWKIMKNVILNVVFSLRLVYLHFWPQRLNLNKLGRGLLGDAT